jgi:hypothetical protein
MVPYNCAKMLHRPFPINLSLIRVFRLRRMGRLKITHWKKGEYIGPEI